MACLLLALTLVVMLLLGPVIGEVQRQDEETKYATLLEWIQRNNGGLYDAHIQSVPGMGMALVTTRTVKESTLISSTPLTTVINIEHAWASNDFGLIANDLFYLSDINLKSLFVLYERLKPGSFWEPYLRTLPSQFHTTLFFDGGELSELQSSMVKEFSLKQQEAAYKVYLKIKADLKDALPNVLTNFTRDDFYWGLSVWSSRAHTIEVKDRDGQWERASCLVPLADLLNMALTQGQANVICDTNEASTHFECRTSRTLAAGEQLLVDYGADPATRHNGRLLMHYGFVAQDNPFDSISLKVPQLDANLPDYLQRAKLAQKLPVMSNTFFQLSRPQDPFFTVGKLLMAFRLLEGTPADIAAAEIDPLGLSKPFSVQGEKKAVRAAVNYLKKVLGAYNTTAEEDRWVLGHEVLSLNAQLAVMLRMEEKHVLMQNITYLKQLLKSKNEL